MKFLPVIRKQQGLALIMAVLIAALAASAIAFAAWRQQVRLRDAELRTDSAQAQQIARSSITLARTLLVDDTNQGTNSPPVDYRGEFWSKPIDKVAVEQGKVSGRLTDVQGHFNLNTLLVDTGNGIQTIKPQQLDVYKRLLVSLGISIELADRLADWLDGDDQPVSGGGEDAIYLSKDPPYRTANRPLADLEELRLVDGYTPEIIEKLRPHVIALPRITRVNINTTTPEVLAACIPGLSVSEAKNLLTSVNTDPYRSLAEVENRLSDAMKNALNTQSGLRTIFDENLYVTSEYFQLDMQVLYGKVVWAEQVLLWRNLTPGVPPKTLTLWRKRVSP